MADRIEMWPVSRIVPYDRNPRTHSEAQIEQICASIRQFGFVNPVIVASDDGILAGHGRLRAAMKIGLREIPVIPVDHLTPEQRRAYIIADNKLAENSGWDMDLLRDEIISLGEADFDTQLLGFSEKELKEIMEEFTEPEDGATDQDDAPAAPESASQVVSRLHDIWLLGPHRLYVGDMRTIAAREAVLEGCEAALVVTDPPYNVDITGFTADRLKIQGDSMSPEAFEAFLSEVLVYIAGMLAKSGSLYLFYPEGPRSIAERSLDAAGFSLRSVLVWAKNTFRLNYARYKHAHEPILYCHLQNETDEWYGDTGQSTVWWEKKPAANREHPTMKPVELLERAIVNSSRRGDLVVDPFGGSGSTLIACQRMGRACGMIEIDPFYADVILRRWMAYTKKQAYLKGDGPFSAVERWRFADADAVTQ